MGEVTKGWTRYRPDDGRPHCFDESLGEIEGNRISYLKSECGKDWYEYAESLPKGLFVVAYDDNGTIFYTGDDATFCHPVGMNVKTFETLPEGFSGLTQHEFAMVDGEIVKCPRWAAFKKDRELKALVERIHTAEVHASMNLPHEDIVKLKSQYLDVYNA